MYAKKGSGKKVIVTLLAIVMLLVCTIGGTLAWLAAETESVENTFTAGNITITLTETFNAKSNGATDDDKWVGKIVPGAKEPKDPKITVEEGSEKCYVYALVDNKMVIDDVVVVTLNISTTDWTVVATSGTKTLYRYNTAVDASAADVECKVFTEVTYDGEKITEANIGALAANTIVVDAYAHQSENTTQAVSDAAAIAHFGLTTN